MEKVYKTMTRTGAGAIVLGIILITAGLACGILSVVNGAVLLRRRDEITF